MKKLFLILVLLTSSFTVAFAKDKARVKVGPIQYKSINSNGNSSVAAAQQASFINISIGGQSGSQTISSGVLSVIIPMSEIPNLEKKYTLPLASIADDGENPSEAVVIFQVTKTKINGLKTKTIGISSNNDTEANGKFKVVKYNPDTKELSFSMNGKIKNYTSSKNNENKDLTKVLPIRANVTVTLP